MNNYQDRKVANEAKLYLIGLLLLIGFAISQRTLDDFLTYPSFIAAIMALVLLMLGVQDNLSNRKGNFLKKDWYITTVIVVVGIIFLSLSFYSCWVALKTIYLWQMRVAHAPFNIFITAALTFLAGLALFNFRKKARALYGLTEIVVGVSIAVYRISISGTDLLNSSSEVYIAILTAGVYLVVRGLDNIDQGNLRLHFDQIIWFIKKHSNRAPPVN